MEFCNYKCVITGGSFNNIHHQFAFRDIVDEAIENTNMEVKPRVMDYSPEEFETLRKEVMRLHDVYGIGACLHGAVHKLFHDNYGYTGFSPYDFLEFIQRIENGEFQDWFDENNLEVNINEDYLQYLSDLLDEQE